MKTDLIDLTRQCCDADGYLSLGYRCAQTNFCYDELRPIGDPLWFSLPYRLGLNENCLFYMQGLLVLLVGYSLFRLFGKIGPAWALAMAALLIQIGPTFFNSLADTPASLFLVEGLVLALIATQREHAGLFFLAGISLGCSALLRAAYFNPLCAAGLVFFIFWFWQTAVKKQTALRNSILILSFTLPMTVQFYASWKNMHEWSFASRAQTHAQLNDHLNSTVVGYDTLLIESSYYWAPPCAPSKGVWTGIKEGNSAGLFCLLSNRVRFYFGSYAPHTFYGDNNKNFINNGFAEGVGNSSAWGLHNITSTQYAARSPAGNIKASRLSPHNTTDDNQAYVQSTSLLPLRPGTYRYSIWLWTPAGQPATKVSMQFFSKRLSSASLDWSSENISQETIELSTEPKQFFFETRLPELSYLVTRINPSADVFAWGAMLETTNTSTGYIKSQQLLYSPIGSTTQLSGHERLFSTTLLVANVIATLASFWFLFLSYIKTRSPLYIFTGTLLVLVLIEAMLILPEQRFLQASLAMHWILFFLLLDLLIAKKYKTPGGAI